MFKKHDKNINNTSKNEEALSYFTEIEKHRERSKKIAWIISGVAVFICLVLAIAIMLILPLKEVKPYIIKVETTTGYVETLSNVNANDISDIEAVDKHFIVKYLQSREGYHYNIIKNEYRDTILMSSEDVASIYKKRFAGNSSPVKILEDRAEINIRPISIQITKSRHAGKRVATVRFDAIQEATLATQEYSEDETEISEYGNVKRYIVNIEYGYITDKSVLSATQRLYNPLGFTVFDYRLSEELLK